MFACSGDDWLRDAIIVNEAISANHIGVGSIRFGCRSQFGEIHAIN